MIDDNTLSVALSGAKHINVERLDALLKENPEIFYKRNK